MTNLCYFLKKRGFQIMLTENILHYLWKITKSYVRMLLNQNQAVDLNQQYHYSNPKMYYEHMLVIHQIIMVINNYEFWWL